MAAQGEEPLPWRAVRSNRTTTQTTIPSTRCLNNHPHPNHYLINQVLHFESQIVTRISDCSGQDLRGQRVRWQEDQDHLRRVQPRAQLEMWLGLPDGVLNFIQDGNTNNHKCKNITMRMSNSDCGREWKHDPGQVVWVDEASSGDEPD